MIIMLSLFWLGVRTEDLMMEGRREPVLYSTRLSVTKYWAITNSHMRHNPAKTYCVLRIAPYRVGYK